MSINLPDARGVSEEFCGPFLLDNCTPPNDSGTYTILQRDGGRFTSIYSETVQSFAACDLKGPWSKIQKPLWIAFRGL